MATLSTSMSASTHAVAAEAAQQTFLVEAGDTPANAIDAVLAGVLALAFQMPGVLLGSGTILLGGTGEGLLAIDGRARQPGLGAARPRGFKDEREIPDAARIAVPLLPAALTLAHAGRGVKTRTALVRIAGAVAQTRAATEHSSESADARHESLRAFGREGGALFRAGPIRDALLAASARSVGGVLTPEDLDALRPEIVQATRVELDARRWALAPWATRMHSALTRAARGSIADATLADPASVPSIPGEVAVIAASDARGAVAIAAILIPAFATLLENTGLSAPHLARPVLRSVTREAPGAPLAGPASIGIAHRRTIEAGKSELAGVDLAVGVGGPGDVEEVFAQIARGLSRALASVDEVIATRRARRAMDADGHATVALEESLDAAFGVATGITLDPRGRARAIVDPRRL